MGPTECHIVRRPRGIGVKAVLYLVSTPEDRYKVQAYSIEKIACIYNQSILTYIKPIHTKHKHKLGALTQVQPSLSTHTSCKYNYCYTHTYIHVYV